MNITLVKKVNNSFKCFCKCFRAKRNTVVKKLFVLLNLPYHIDGYKVVLILQT